MLNRRNFLVSAGVMGVGGVMGAPRQGRTQGLDLDAMQQAAQTLGQAGQALIGQGIPSRLQLKYAEIKGRDGHERDELIVKGPPRYYIGSRAKRAQAAAEILKNAMIAGKWDSSQNREIIRRAYSGRGSPEDIRLVLRWLDWERGNLPSGTRMTPEGGPMYQGNRGPSATLAERTASLQRHFDDYIRVDCNGFAGTYYKEIPAIAARYSKVALEETSPLNYAVSLSQNGARCQKALGSLLMGDAVVYLGVSHIAVIEQVRPAASKAAALADYMSLGGWNAEISAWNPQGGYDSLVQRSLPAVTSSMALEPEGPCAVLLTAESCNDGFYDGMLLRANIVTLAGTAQPEAGPSNQRDCYNPDYKSKRPDAIQPERMLIPCEAPTSQPRVDWVTHPRRPSVPAFRIHNNMTSGGRLVNGQLVDKGRGRLVAIVRM